MQALYNRHIRAAATLGVAVFCFSNVAQAQTPPTRHLVYDFTVGVKTDKISSNSATETASGSSDFGELNSDKGQITVDISGVEPDGGLVLAVSESSRNGRTSKPITCVVYPDTSTICAAGDVRPEEESVIRTLSPKFFDASALDANRHWQVSNASAGVKIDFTASPNPDGITVGITSERVQNSANGNTVHANGKYSYNTAKLLPTTLSEYETIREQGGASSYQTTIIDITANLTTDSKV
jgi:hypothetical protein